MLLGPGLVYFQQGFDIQGKLKYTPRVSFFLVLIGNFAPRRCSWTQVSVRVTKEGMHKSEMGKELWIY